MFNPERVRLVTTVSGFSPFYLYTYPGFSLRSNPGLQLANAFGVEADVFEVPNWHLKI